MFLFPTILIPFSLVCFTGTNIVLNSLTLLGVVKASSVINVIPIFENADDPSFFSRQLGSSSVKLSVIPGNEEVCDIPHFQRI